MILGMRWRRQLTTGVGLHAALLSRQVAERGSLPFSDAEDLQAWLVVHQSAHATRLQRAACHHVRGTERLPAHPALHRSPAPQPLHRHAGRPRLCARRLGPAAARRPQPGVPPRAAA